MKEWLEKREGEKNQELVKVRKGSRSKTKSWLVNSIMEVMRWVYRENIKIVQLRHKGNLDKIFHGEKGEKGTELEIY